MAILKVARMGHPVLRKKAAAISTKEIHTPAFAQLVHDMVETMREYNGLGLAAPQVHRSLRVCVIEVHDTKAYDQQIVEGVHVFINPKLTVKTKSKSAYWEGCLSVPGLRGLVPRPNEVFVEYLDAAGKPQELAASGFLATVLQHEFDHLDGVLYVDRLANSKDLVFEEEFDRYHTDQKDNEKN